MKQIVVGTFEIGYDRATVILRSGTGGNIIFSPEGNGVAHIFIGADFKQWRDVIGTLLHECMEFCMSKMECSYRPGNFISHDSANYHFVMNHMQFSECCCRSSELITPAIPVLAKAWNRWNADKKKTTPHKKKAKK